MKALEEKVNRNPGAVSKGKSSIAVSLNVERTQAAGIISL